MLSNRKKFLSVLSIFSLFLFSIVFTKTTVYAKEIIDENTTLIQQHYSLSYKINKGDTLWGISQRFGVSIEDLKNANNLKGDLIISGHELKIPRTFYIVHSEGETYKIANRTKDKRSVTVASLPAQTYKKDDRYWLAKIIEAEASTESLEGKIAVGAVVINRVEADWFPDTIKEVIFQKFNGKYQFSPVGNGRIHKVEPSEEAYDAADRALAGEDPTDGALYFYNPKISKSKFFKNRESLVTIGNHQFFQ